MIERQIIIGFITSSEFLIRVKDWWNVRYLESKMARRLSAWCWEYYKEFGKAPGKNIKTIYFEKIRLGLDKDIAEDIEQQILPGLSDEFEETGLDLESLLISSKRYFNEKHIKLHNLNVEQLIQEGKIEEAEQASMSFTPLRGEDEDDINLANESSLNVVDEAFRAAQDILVEFPGIIGEFWNDQFIRGNFLSFMGPEKRGKTFRLLDVGMRAARQFKNVAFFQAGDMNKMDQLMRICINLSGKSNKEKYCGEMWEPTLDCIYNQTDLCTRSIRECNFGIFPSFSPEVLKKEVTQKMLIEEYENNPNYLNCYNCIDFQRNSWGTPWLTKVNVGDPLTPEEAKKYLYEFFVKYGRNFFLSTHANGTLTLPIITTKLNYWWKRFGFIPDVILIDYADIMAVETRMDTREKENYIWKGLRQLSQTHLMNKLLPLVITATQSDADSYGKDRLKASNFSEDKRKLAHVSAMYGLNQDTKDREKELGVIRINEIGVREGEYFNKNEVNLLQNLKRGKTLLNSYK